jgi:diguanylate cyclase (GGDEF)-like protein/PAS domain S-box-containing protein
MKASRALTLINLGAGLLILVLAAANIWLERKQALQDAEIRLTAVNLALAEQLERSLQAADLALADLVDEVGQSRNWKSPDIHSHLKSHASALPQIRALAAVDADGNIVNDSAVFPVTPIYVGDREYFAAMRSNPASNMFISAPIMSRRDQAWTVVLARPIAGKDGSFRGLIFARLRPQYFQDLYKNVLQQEGSAVSVYRRDGTLLFRQPHAEDWVGRSFAHLPLFQELLPQASQGVFERRAEIDGKQRVFSYRALRDYPVVVISHQGKADILANWRANSLRTLILAGIAMLAVSLLMRRLALAFRQQETSAEAVHENEMKLRFMTDNMVDVVWTWEPGKGITYASPSIERLLGRPAQAFLGKPLSDICADLTLDRLQEKVAEQLAANPACCDQHCPDLTFECERPGHGAPAIWTENKLRLFFRPDSSLTLIQGMSRDITALKSTQQQLESLANFDALTGLPNRVLLADRLQQAVGHAKRNGQLLAVCFLDLDDFKPINDRYGHETGDRLLVEMAGQLSNAVRNGDTVARLGGDEFVLLLSDINSVNDLEPALVRVLDTIASTRKIGGIDIQVSASIGVALYPFDEADPDTLLRHADQAMYQAKQAGRNRYHLFDAEHNQQIQNRHLQLERLRQAMQQGELVLYYQPKVNMRSGRVIGMEALLRWQHPERGLLGPLEFLPLAEQTDLIADIGEWVLHQALEQIAAWSANGQSMRVSVNIAARHFQQSCFVSRLEEILAQYPTVSPQQLELEILETAALADMTMVSRVIQACQALGVTFALDDFGTGYSSLTYLKRLPADTLKIDKSFVRDMLDDQEDLAIVEGVISLATVFHRDLIAEGVETSEHGVLLMRLGCDCAQGYGIARPMPAADVPGWVAQFKPDPSWALWANMRWDVRLFPLIMAQYDHREWVSRVIAAVEHPAQQPAADELNDQHACRFGRWYDGEGKKSCGHLPEYADIDSIHGQVHLTGVEIVRLRDAGKIDEARALCQHLLTLRDQILEKLDRLQQSVATQL